jgi:hypothetical protein
MHYKCIKFRFTILVNHVVPNSEITISPAVSVGSNYQVFDLRTARLLADSADEILDVLLRQGGSIENRLRRLPENLRSSLGPSISRTYLDSEPHKHQLCSHPLAVPLQASVSHSHPLESSSTKLDARTSRKVHRAVNRSGECAGS